MKYLLIALLLTAPYGALSCPAHWEQEHIVAYIHSVNKKAPSEAIGAAIVSASSIHQVDPWLIVAQMEIESGFNPLATGLKGERGLLQIRQSTAEDLNLNWENAHDILLNVEAGTRYMATHLRKYSNVERALSRYNGRGEKSKLYAANVKARYLRIVWSQL